MSVAKVTLNGTALMDITDSTITAAKVLASEKAYNKAGAAITGTYTVPTGTISITQNGTVDVTQYASANVSVSGGGATNFVTGTFTTGSSTSTTGSVSVNYTGSGYPVMLVITVENGAYNSSVSGWYNSLTRYAVGQFTMTKAVATSTPTYTTSGNANYGVVALIYKNSTSNATTYSRTSTMTANSYSSSNANGTSTTCVRWKGNGKTISYYVCGGSSSTYGLLASTTYRYYAVYSS